MSRMRLDKGAEGSTAANLGVKEYREKHHITVFPSKDGGTEDSVAPAQSFTQLNVPDNVKAPLVSVKKFTSPTPIQAQSWPLVLKGHDVVGVAQTGSGKTYAFMLPAVLHIHEKKKSQKGGVNSGSKIESKDPVALILAPTRELCQQISQVASEFSQCCKIRVVTIFGGASRSKQKYELNDRAGVDLIVATPGRLIDFLESEEVDLSRVSYCVLDEADRMLDMGFYPQISKIMTSLIPSRSSKGRIGGRQTLMFSATWPRMVEKMADEFLHKFVKINIGSEERSANHKISQQIIMFETEDEREKQKCLLKHLDEIRQKGKENKTIVFVNYTKYASLVALYISSKGFSALAMHGKMSQSERNRSLRQFKTSAVKILVATDVASRGLDIEDVDYVINFDYPLETDSYIHRIGRTARGTSAKQGVAISFFTPPDHCLSRDLVNILEEAQQPVPPELREATKVPQKSMTFNGVKVKDSFFKAKGVKPKKIKFTEENEEEDD